MPPPSAAITCRSRGRSGAIDSRQHGLRSTLAVPYTVSFVLTADFERRKLHLWAGHSGTLKKRNTGDLIAVSRRDHPAGLEHRGPPICTLRDQRDGLGRRWHPDPRRSEAPDSPRVW